MGAFKSGAYPVRIGEKEYGLLFSLNALDEVQEKFGGYDKLGEVFNDKNPNFFKDTRWLLTLLLNEGLQAEDENAVPLDEKKVGRMIHAGNLQEIQNSIFLSFARGASGDSEGATEVVEEDQGNRETVQEG